MRRSFVAVELFQSLCEALPQKLEKFKIRIYGRTGIDQRICQNGNKRQFRIREKRLSAGFNIFLFDSDLQICKTNFLFPLQNFQKIAGIISNLVPVFEVFGALKVAALWESHYRESHEHFLKRLEVSFGKNFVLLS